jgi:type II secretory pathway component GspD/PulD (secretin)
MITITASPDVVNRLERDISLIDRGRRQIEISARFVVIEWEKGTNLGAQWGDVNFSALGLGNLIKSGLTGLTANFTAALSSILTANGYDTNVKSVAEPRITVEDGEKGEVSATEEHTIPILSGGGQAYSYYTTKEISVGVKMKVQPSITRDGQVKINLSQEVSDIVGESEFKQVGGASQMIPIVARRTTETILKIRNGETVAIGGLMNNMDQTKKSGIPFFRKIPVAGRFFGNKNQSSKQSELVVFITPRVIYETPPPVLY